MSENGLLQQFNINELAGATGLILGAIGGLLAVIWKSRCYCRMNLCYLCFCERKPPPDKNDSSDEETKPDDKADDKPEVSNAKREDEKLIPDKKLERKDSMIITEQDKEDFKKDELELK